MTTFRGSLDMTTLIMDSRSFSPIVAQQFLKRGLLDEIVLGVVPIILGDGIPLFNNIDKQIDLSLADVKRLDKGLVLLVYDEG
jgi:dihydrofolate reductase